MAGFRFALRELRADRSAGRPCAGLRAAALAVAADFRALRPVSRGDPLHGAAGADVGILCGVAVGALPWRDDLGREADAGRDAPPAAAVVLVLCAAAAGWSARDDALVFQWPAAGHSGLGPWPGRGGACGRCAAGGDLRGGQRRQPVADVAAHRPRNAPGGADRRCAGPAGAGHRRPACVFGRRDRTDDGRDGGDRGAAGHPVGGAFAPARNPQYAGPVPAARAYRARLHGPGLRPGQGQRFSGGRYRRPAGARAGDAG